MVILAPHQDETPRFVWSDNRVTIFFPPHARGAVLFLEPNYLMLEVEPHEVFLPNGMPIHRQQRGTMVVIENKKTKGMLGAGLNPAPPVTREEEKR